MHFERTLRLGAFAAAVLAGVVPASAQTLHDLVEAASVRNPELASLQGRRDAVAARQQAADALTPGAPSLGASYVTDQAFQNRQQREAQIGVSTPLWLPGEGTATRRVADTEMVRVSARADALKLKLAGQVREALADFSLAQEEMRVAERRLRDFRALEDDVRRRFAARDAAEADLLLAHAERIAADADLREKQAALAQARVEFSNLTGMAPVTAALNEPAPPDTAASAHPRIEDAKRAVDVAQANRALAAVQVRDSPEIGLIARRNRDIYGTVYDNSIGIELRIPFATQARNAPRQAAAQADLTEASVGYAAAERDVAAEQQKARIGYDNALVQRDLARERAGALAQQVALVSRAYRGGEVSLMDIIRARTLAYDADTGQARAEIGVARARGRLNQALGIIP